MRLWGNFLNCRGRIFFLAAQPLEASREIPFLYDETVSGASVYNYFRDYSPDIGRYIESDPIGLKGGLNTYGYVEADPVAKKDPKGLLDPFSEVSAEIATQSGGVDPSTFDPNAIFPTRELFPFPVIRCEDGVPQSCVLNDPTTLIVGLVKGTRSLVRKAIEESRAQPA